MGKISNDVNQAERAQVLVEEGKLLLVWMNEKQLASDTVREAMIWEKAGKLHSDLLQENPSTSDEVQQGMNLKIVGSGLVNPAREVASSVQ